LRPTRLFLGLVASVLLTVAALGAIWLWPLETAGGLKAELEGNPDHGAYIARMAGCIGCHSDLENGGPALAGGPPLDTSFGTFRAPNITPDPEHGIGAWSRDAFAVAVRHGLSPGGEPYYPAFPYTFYTRLTDQDVADLFAAIWTVPPVGKPSETHQLVFPFDQRPALKPWRAMFFEPGVFEGDSDRSPLWNRGAYIVEGPAHCGACHTPRNVLGAREAERALHGAEGLPGGDDSPPITEAALRKNGWSRSDLAFALRTGLKPDGDSFGGSMGEVVRDSTRFLSDQDLQAIATYLLPGQQTAETER
jgi:mono/diheme cytochrome c family protein